MPTPLGERVRELKLKRGLTLEALAERVGSSKSYMWEIENKEVTRPSAEKLQQIALALETTTDYLLTVRRTAGDTAPAVRLARTSGGDETHDEKGIPGMTA